jgi:hypothetical protein
MSRPSAWIDRRLVVNSHYVALCLTPKDFRRELKHLKVPRERRPDFLATARADATTHYFERKGKYCAIVCMAPEKKRKPLEICGLLVHEAVHIWQAHCDSIGERTPSAEFEAYSVQAIAQDLMAKFSKLRGLK